MILNGKVYICGGFHRNECLFITAYYIPQTSQWMLITPMTNRRSRLEVIAYGGQIYAVGGYDCTNRLRCPEVYNPLTHSWRHISNISQCSKFAIEVVDELLFVAEGYTGFATTNNVECCDQKTDEWFAVKEVGILCRALSCCVVSGLPKMAEYAIPRDKVLQSSGSF